MAQCYSFGVGCVHRSVLLGSGAADEGILGGVQTPHVVKL